MSSHTIEDLTSCILDFQANFIRVTYRKKTTLVDVEAEPAHAAALKAIWASSKLTELLDENGQVLKWRLLGFDSENVEQEFNEVGALGLECLVRSSSLWNRICLTCCFRENSSRWIPIFPRSVSSYMTNKP
jgi:engulfment/cell motility protein 1